MGLFFKNEHAVFAAFLLSSIAFAAHAEDLPLWRNGVVSGSADSGLIYTVTHQAFDRRQGIRVEMDALKGDPLLLKALIAGQLESYEGGLSSPLIAASKGADIRIIACPGQKQNYTLWAKPGIATLNDLRGRLVGISTPGSAPDNFIHAAMERQHVPVAEVKFVAIGTPPELLRSIGANIIDAAALTNDLDHRAAGMGLSRLTTSDAATPLAMRRCLLTTGAVLRQKHDQVVAFLAAEIEAYIYALGHRDETVALTREIIQARPDAEEPAAAYNDMITRQTVSTDFSVPMDKVSWQSDALARSGQLAPGFDPASIVDIGPLEAARRVAP